MIPERRRWLIRHGESVANAGAVTTDPATIPLTEAGRDQARSIAKTITRRPDLIVISSYLRTQQTAGPSIGRFPDVPVETWPVQEFTYLSPGRCVGTTAAQRRPLVEAYWQRRDAGHVDGAGAESFTAMLRRVRVLRDQLATHPAGFIVVFTHGQIMQSLRLLTLYPDMDDPLLMARFLAFDRQEPVHNGQILVV